MSVFITGASAGIGEACAWAFAKEGFDLVLNARRKERLEELSKAIRDKHSVKVELVVFDVREKHAWADWAKQNPQTLKNISVLVNNAGLAQGLEPLQEGHPDDWDVMIDTNVKGALYAIHAVLPTIIACKGHLVNLGSVAGRWAYPKGNVYCASKAALHSISEAIRLDLHGSGVRVTEIAPGMVETDFSEVRFKGDKARAEKVYAGAKALQPEDIAETVVWCVKRPEHVNIQEVVLFPTDQACVTMLKREPAP